MKLYPTSLLSLGQGGRQVRLSLLLEDDDGCRKGLTVVRLLQGVESQNLSLGKRPLIFCGQEHIGLVDPHDTGWGDPLQNEGLGFSGRVLTGGALTCAFTASDEIEPSGLFDPIDRFTIADTAEYAGCDVRILGEGFVGTILDDQSYLPWEDAHIYPLLRLRRRKLDLVQSASIVRNGAMVTTDSGKLVGVVVSVDADLSHYTVAPLRDILEWHRLRLAQFPWRPYDKPKANIRAGVDRGKTPDVLSPRLLALVG